MVVHGKGAKGRVIDIINNDPNDKDTLFRLLQDAGIVELYSLTNEDIVPKQISGADLNRFRGRLSSGMIAKQFYGKEAEESFHREIDAYRTLVDTYGSKALREFTSVKTVRMKDNPVIGIIAYDANMRKPMYFIFNAKCELTIDKVPTMTREMLIRLTYDILASIHVLQTSNRGHFDIKPDNIMMCGTGRKFKLIDWDLSHEFNDFKDRHYGSKAFSSPLSWHISKYGPISFAVGSFGRNIWPKSEQKEIFNHPEMRERLQTHVIPVYQKIVDSATSKEHVYAEYKFTFDLYNLGMTLLFLVIKNNLLSKAGDVVIFAQDLLKAEYKDAETALQAASKTFDAPAAASTGRIVQANETTPATTRTTVAPGTKSRNSRRSRK